MLIDFGIQKGEFILNKNSLIRRILSAGIVFGAVFMVTQNVYADSEIKGSSYAKEYTYDGAESGNAVQAEGDKEDLPELLEPVTPEMTEMMVDPVKKEAPADIEAVDGSEQEEDLDYSACEALLAEINDPKEGFSTTGTGGFVYRMYKVVLGREPDTEGYNYWVNKLNSKELAAADIVSGFFGSDEYKSFGKTNSAMVTDFYAAMLDRTPDEEGYNYWTNRLNIGMTGQSIAAGFVNSPEFEGICSRYGINNGTVTLSLARDQNYERTYFVYRLYKNCLEREPDTDGQEYWCGKIGEGYSGAETAKGFLFSDEYKSWHTENSEFVNMLYKTILGREAETEGYNYWVNLLDYTTTRERVLNGFLFSPEFRGQCSAAGINVGDPIYEPDDTEAWQHNIRILELCNNIRSEYGLKAYKTNEWLWNEIAMVRAEETSHLYSHTRPDGRDWYTAYSDVGITYYKTSENIVPRRDPESAVDAWMNSTGHRSNILNKKYDQLATGMYQGDYWKYYCQNFRTSQ